jgi:hypothetical protein
VAADFCGNFRLHNQRGFCALQNTQNHHLLLIGFGLGPPLGVFNPIEVPLFEQLMHICLVLIFFEGGPSVRTNALKNVEKYVVLF